MNETPLYTFDFSFSSQDCSDFFDATRWQFHKRPTTPPTLITMCRKGEFESLKKLKVPLQNVLHGEQEYRFSKELTPENSYRCETFLKSKHEKSGSLGKMTFMVFLTTISDSLGVLCAESLTTIIVREPKGAS